MFKFNDTLEVTVHDGDGGTQHFVLERCVTSEEFAHYELRFEGRVIDIMVPIPFGTVTEK